MEEDAVELAAFSLCLGMCDALEPAELRSTIKLFPELIGKTIHESCFFEAKDEGLIKSKVGIVVGNPPFVSKLTTPHAEAAYLRYQEEVPPNDKKRDEREYVINAYGSTGGIQRFKEGNHGAAHDFAEMIGYVQDATGFRKWFQTINSWIDELVSQSDKDWSEDDQLTQLTEDTESRTCQCRSNHERAGRNPIELWHAWVNLWQSL